MDWQLVIDAVRQFINWGLAKLAEYTSTFNEIQWVLLILGAVVTALAVYSAFRAYKPMSYRLSIFAAKLGLTMIVLAFAWPYATDLYSTAMAYTGNPVLGLAAVVAGSFLGYHVVKLLFAKRARA